MAMRRDLEGRLWEASPAERRWKDVDGRWTKKNGRSYYGYKNHICIDSRHKIIRCCTTTPASAHDGREGRKLVAAADNDSPEVYGDSAYRSQDMEDWLGEQGLVSRINRKGCRCRPLGESGKAANRVRSKTRAHRACLRGAHRHGRKLPALHRARTRRRRHRPRQPRLQLQALPLPQGADPRLRLATGTTPSGNCPNDKKTIREREIKDAPE